MAAQRWNRLESKGLAWLVVYEALGTHPSMAFVTVSMEVDQRETVIDELSADDQVMVLSEGSQASELHITVAADSLETLIGHVLDRIAHVPGVIDVHARIVARLLAEWASWRLDALDAEQRKLAQASAKRNSVGVWIQSAGPAFDEDSRALAQAVIRDPRARISGLAAELGKHEATVRRQMNTLLNSGAVTVRCEMAYDVSGWPIERSWFLRVPDAGIAALTAVAREYRGLRPVALNIGDANIVFTALSRTLEESVVFENPAARFKHRAHRYRVSAAPTHLEADVPQHGTDWQIGLVYRAGRRGSGSMNSPTEDQGS